jgi:hypothetical protein
VSAAISLAERAVPLTLDLAEPANLTKQRREFLTALYGRARDGYFFVIWTTPDKQTHGFPATPEGIERALAKVGELDDGSRDIYTSMYMLDAVPSSGRGDLDAVRAMCALWIDVDIAGPNHKSATAYPATEQDAQRIIDALPMPASSVVHSGGGLHGYCFLAEPMYFQSGNAAGQVGTLRDRWKIACQEAAQSLGFAVDSVWDFTRVMRLPTTFNVKVPPAVRSSVRRFDASAVYSEAALDGKLPTLVVGSARVRRSTVAGQVDGLNYLDELPERVRLAIDEDIQFRATWKNCRTDFTDRSPSSYCWTLAKTMVKLGLSDQEIADVLYTWRVDNNAQEKPLRWYMVEMIGKARAECDKGTAAKLTWQPPKDEEIEQRLASEERSAAPLTWLQSRRVFERVPIVGARKIGQRGGQIDLLLIDDRVIPMGTASDVLNPQRARENIADAIAVVIPEVRRKDWSAIAEAILTIAGPGESIGTEPDEEMREWIEAYLGHLESRGYISCQYGFSVVDTNDRDAFTIALLAMDLPYDKAGAFRTPDGRVYIHAHRLMVWLNSDYYRVKVGREDLQIRLRRMGFEPQRPEMRWRAEQLKASWGVTGSLPTTKLSGTTKTRVWVSPSGFVPAE